MRANKLLGKTNWFKGGKDKVKYDKGNRKTGKTYAKEEARRRSLKQYYSVTSPKVENWSTP